MATAKSTFGEKDDDRKDGQDRSTPGGNSKFDAIEITPRGFQPIVHLRRQVFLVREGGLYGQMAYRSDLSRV